MRSFRERYADLNKQERSQPIRREPIGTPIEMLQPGSFRRNSLGEVFVAEARRADEHLAALSARTEVRSNLYFRQFSAATISPNDILFLDTETTGLAGGTGTHAFLVGLGFFEGSEFVLHQYFMRSPAEEPSLLEELRQVLERFSVLVTFNGKSFDWPLIDTRFLINGYRLEFGFSHLDLLHPSRRIWKHRLASCSLTSLEQNVFGIHRHGDVPGYLIPQLYFDFLRDGDARRLSPVFFHNREDIVTLARLLEVLLIAESQPTAALDFAEDRVGMALTLISAGEIEIGVETLADALSSDDVSPEVRRRGEVELWRILKRSGQSQDGVHMLERMCQDASRAFNLDLYPFVELAKYHEHVSRDYHAAASVVERALRMIELRGQTAGREELLHRLRRIRRKQVTH